MYPMAAPVWERLLAIDSPWFWLVLAAWILASDLLAPRWHVWWNAGCIGAVWMGVALTVLPWHLFEAGGAQTMGLWTVWVAVSGAVGLCGRAAYAYRTRHVSTGGFAPGPQSGNKHKTDR